jgi:hypothetical protein
MVYGKFFSSPRFFDDLDRCKINSCWTVQPNKKDMPRDSEKTIEFGKG